MAKRGYNFSRACNFYHSHGIATMSPDLPTPRADLRFEEVFDFPFIVDDESANYLANHGRVMFIVRGPSGTRKHTLASLVISKYPNSEMCCADEYFSEPFIPNTKSRDTLKESHRYCEEKALKACQENKHPIIIKNTNMRKWEMQRYIDLAIEYCYTVVMAITLRKLSATPEVLENTNTQGLKKIYFMNRLRQWEEVIPKYTGWMLCPADVAYLTVESKKCLESLAEVNGFSEVLCMKSKGDPIDFFKPECFPFCIATHCDLGANSLAKQYYLSKTVQNAYGRTFPLVVQAFVVSKSLTAAVVYLKESMKDLIVGIDTHVPLNADDLSDALGALNTLGDVQPKQPVADFIENSEETYTFCERSDNEKFDTNNCSFIILFKAVSSNFLIKNVPSFRESLFSDVMDSDGYIHFTSFKTLSNDFKYCKLASDSWLILPPREVIVQSVFTGLYN